MGGERPGEDPIRDILRGSVVFGPEIDEKVRQLVAASPSRPVTELLATLLWAWPWDGQQVLNPVGLATVLDRLADLVPQS
ncbi:hypothetical protein [Rhabdaerophilum sp. SD176]|uniref:hypothetical protein n=1 Tax=Rhabdaerophilum sp. SD176 TaxID=2983548 RepID=UPI0024E02753|nr:hypothetical protein [Rhabdaerophilum sp. SD176]